MRPFPSRLLSILLLPATLLVATGCGVSPAGPATTNLHAQGAVFGGQQPVAGSTIQLYTVGTSGDGSPASPQLTQTVTSGNDGSFTITNLYPCTPGTLVYLTATGGSPTTTNGVAGPVNSNLAMLSILGTCDQLKVTPFIIVNEVTTAAGISAVAPFMSSFSAVGSYTSDLSALTSAFNLATEFANPATGASPGLNVPSGYTVPSDEIYTLANILAACINTYGGTAGDATPCGQLFTLTTPQGVAPPTDTIQAMLYLALHPTFNTSTLFTLPTPNSPFQPALTAQPADFTVVLAAASSLTASPAALVFPDTSAASGASLLNVTLINNGASAINITSAMVAGPNAADFKASSGCSLLGAHATCSIQVNFVPLAGAYGNRSAVLNIATSTSGSIAVPLTGVGTNGSSGLFALPGSLTFTALQVGVPTTPQTVAVVNAGSSVVTLKSIGFSGPLADFTQTNNCPAYLAAGSACTVTITDTPSSNTVTQTSILRIASTSPSSPISINLTEAPAVVGPVTYTDSSLFTLSNGGGSYGQPSYTAAIDGGSYSLTNSGNLPLLISSVSVSDGFVVASNTCGSSVAPGTTCTISYLITYFGLTSYTGTLTIVDNYSSSPHSLPIFTHISTSSPTPANTVFEDFLPFGTAAVGTTHPVSYSFFVSYYQATTSNALYFSSSTTNGEFSITPSVCQVGTAYNALGCTYTISFVPQGLGPRYAIIGVGDNFAPISVAGFGTAAGPVATFIPYFPQYPQYAPATVGTYAVSPGHSATITGTVYNTGTTALNFSGSPVITFTGTNASEFSAATTTCSSLALGANCPVSFTFAPLAAGPRSAFMNVTDTISGTTIQMPVSFLVQ